MKCMADGGIVGSDGMTEAQRAKRNAALSSLGMSTAPAPVQPAQAAPLPQAPVQQPPVQAQDRPRGIIGIVGGRQQQIDKAAGYACGGKIKAHAQGGKISGPGTPTSDSIPAVVEDTGEQIRVANKERIVSQAQDQFLESVARKMGFDNLDAMLEAGTGKPVGPTIKGGKRAAGYGANGEWIPDPEDDKAPSTWSTPGTMSPEEKDWRIKTGNLMSAYPGKPDEYNEAAKNIGNNSSNDPMRISNPILSLSNAVDKGMSAVGNVFADSATANREGVDYSTARANRLAQQAKQAAQPTGQQPTNPIMEGISGFRNASPFGATEKRFPIGSKSEFMTGAKPGEMPSSAQDGFTQDGKSYTVNPTSQTGISRVTAPGTNPLITNIDPEKAVEMMNRFGHMRMNPIDAEHQMPGMEPIIASVGQDAAAGQMAGTNSGQVRIGDGGFNLAGQNDRMAKSLGYAGTDDFNKQWNDRAEAGRGGGVTLVEAAPGKTQAELDNEEKTLRWMAEDILRRGGPGSAAAAAQIMGYIAAERIARTNAEAARYGHDVARYGHDVAARRAVGHDDTLRGIEAMRVAGNQFDNQSKQLSLTQAQKMSDLYDKAAAGDAGALKELQLRNPKEPNYSNRYITLPNRKTYNDMGQITGEDPGGVFDAKTGQLANFGKQGTGVNIEEANKIKAAVASGAMKREDAIKKLQAMGLQ